MPHDKSLNVLKKLIGFCLKGGDRDFLSVDSRCAEWAVKKRVEK